MLEPKNGPFAHKHVFLLSGFKTLRLMLSLYCKWCLLFHLLGSGWQCSWHTNSAPGNVFSSQCVMCDLFKCAKICSDIFHLSLRCALKKRFPQTVTQLTTFQLFVSQLKSNLSIKVTNSRSSWSVDYTDRCYTDTVLFGGAKSRPTPFRWCVIYLAARN